MIDDRKKKPRLCFKNGKLMYALVDRDATGSPEMILLLDQWANASKPQYKDLDLLSAHQSLGIPAQPLYNPALQPVTYGHSESGYKSKPTKASSLWITSLFPFW